MSPLVRARTASPILWWLGMIHLGLVVVALVGLLVDNRQALGINIWIKPLKFAVSIALYAFTYAWLLSYSSMSRRMVQIVSALIALAMLVEIAVIFGQSFRGTTSHFNESSVLNSILFGVMGFFIVLNTLVVTFVAWQFWRQRSVAPESPAFLWSIRLGLTIFLIASLEGCAMIGHGSHTVGGADGGSGLPFVNWSTAYGDLRVAHFFGMHAVQILPLLTLALLRRNPRLSTGIVIAIGFVYLLLFALLTLQALGGRPLLS